MIDVTRDLSNHDVDARRLCAWDELPIPARARRDARFCSKRCRQASHRFHRPSRRAGASQPIAAGPARRFAYADPPYPGLARRYYSANVDYAGEVDHGELIRRLCSFDGWALSTSAAALPAVLASCPAGVRVAAWFRGERPTLSYSPLSSWEPVIYFGARPHLSNGSGRRLDSLIYFARPRLTDRARVIGAKPAEFCAWLFKLLGATAGDELTDLYPGSGGVGKAWRSFCEASHLEAIRVAAACGDLSPVAACDLSRPPGYEPSRADPVATDLRDE